MEFNMHASPASRPLFPTPSTAASRTARVAVIGALTTGALASFAPRSDAQVVFSIDYRGASIGSPATGGGCITEADLLTPAPPGPAYGPLPPPMIFISGGLGPPGPGLGIPAGPGCVCHPPGVPCGREVDALSYGMDARIRPGPMPAGTYVFSVDACTMGLAAAALAPNVTSESPVGDAAGDVFEALGLPGAPVPPGPILGNSGILDGNGLLSPSGALYRGLGLIEPRFPGPALMGDDVDALEIGPPPGPLGGIFWSLDGGFPNVCTGMPNTGSAMANGFLPGMVLFTPAPGAAPAVYAIPPVLGLDLLGPGTDDLDALALAENGVPGFQPSFAPYTWMPGGGAPTDMLLFSVRRGSAVIGAPDSSFGIPIEPGDILMPPIAGGASPFPAIFVAAEALGIATARGGAPMAGELDALDTVAPAQTALPYCFGTPAVCPCGNGGAAGNGCANSVYAGGASLSAAGNASVSADTVVMTASSMPAGPALYFQGTTQIAVPFGDGVRCVGGASIRLAIKISGAAGTSTYPVAGDPSVSLKGAIPPGGGTRFYQCWYRNAGPFCTPSTFNLTNGLAIVWTP
jgi:hypothetical protein